MISVNEADKIIFTNVKPFPSTTVALDNALGRVLRENVKADRDQPPFDKSLLDGIAINSASWQNGIRQFQISGIQPAGQKPLMVKGENSCVEIMTGADVPRGLDAVVPVERILVENKIATLQADWRPAL